MLQSSPGDTPEVALQGQLIAFIRAFGLHRPEQTPCGEPVSVAEAHALMELARSQPLSQNELCERLNLVKGTVSRLVSLLEGRGWVERRRSPSDGRAVELWLTDEGHKAMIQLAEARRVKFAHLLDRIPATEHETVMHTLKLLVEALREP